MKNLLYVNETFDTECHALMPSCHHPINCSEKEKHRLAKMPSIVWETYNIPLKKIEESDCNIHNDDFTSFTSFEICLQRWDEMRWMVPQPRNSSMNFLWNSVRRETIAGILSSWGNMVHLKCQVPGTFETTIQKLEPYKDKQLKIVKKKK